MFPHFYLHGGDVPTPTRTLPPRRPLLPFHWVDPQHRFSPLFLKSVPKSRSAPHTSTFHGSREPDPHVSGEIRHCSSGTTSQNRGLLTRTSDRGDPSLETNGSRQHGVVTQTASGCVKSPNPPRYDPTPVVPSTIPGTQDTLGLRGPCLVPRESKRVIGREETGTDPPRPRTEGSDVPTGTDPTNPLYHEYIYTQVVLRPSHFGRLRRSHPQLFPS